MLEDLRNKVSSSPERYTHLDGELVIRPRIVKRVVQMVEGPHVLSLGYMKDDWTDHLLERGFTVDIVEGSAEFADHARQRYAGQPVRVFTSLFEEWTPPQAYDTIIAGSVIEVIEDPLTLFKTIGTWLAPNGQLIVTTPNSRSMHRRIGALMGIERSPEELNQRAIETYAVKIYDRYRLRSFLVDCGFICELVTGLFLKPLPTAQMAAMSPELLDAFMALGDELLDYASELVAVARPAKR